MKVSYRESPPPGRSESSSATDRSQGLRHGLCDGADRFDEVLRERGEHTTLQGHDPDRHPRIGKCNGQRLERGMPPRYLQHEAREDREKAPCREEIVLHVLGQRHHRRAWRFMSAGAELRCSGFEFVGAVEHEGRPVTTTPTPWKPVTRSLCGSSRRGRSSCTPRGNAPSGRTRPYSCCSRR